MNSSKTFWQTTFVFTFLANLAILAWSISRWAEIGVILYRSVWGVALLLYLGVLAGCVFLFFWIKRSNADSLVARLELDSLSGLFPRLLAGSLFAGILLLIPWLKFTFRIGDVVKKSTQDPVLTTILFYWACWWLVLLAAGALKVAFKTSWQGGFASALVLMGLGYEIFIRLQQVSTYPFSIGWSETSRFYYASLYFSRSVYGESFPLSTLHPTRYFLQSLAFLIPGLDLTAHRFWQFLLWMLLTGATALSLAWRVFGVESNDSRRWGSKIWRFLTPFGWLFAGWFFLFLLRVGVYYHLEVMVFVPILFVSPKHPWRSLIAVIFASLWAGISRVNWFPVPAMLALAIYLLESPISQPGRGVGVRVIAAYLTWPAIWTIAGLLAALAAQAAYIPLSGNANNPEIFASSFSSALLWDRLWPNELYPLGILPAILIVSGPLIVALILATRQWQRLHLIRWAGLWAMILVLFAGSLVVSTKIGGGGDLHNMDAYAVLIGLVAAYFIGDKAVSEHLDKLDDRPAVWGVTNWPVTAIALIIPVMFLIPSLSARQNFDKAWAETNLKQLKTLVESADGPVLFITERHLVTFGQINVPLVPEYERVTLMEAAMSNNQPILSQFYADLQAHRFALIVSGKENLIVKDDESFAEENNVWNERVSPYILCYYEPVALFELENKSRFQVFAPRATPGVCP